MIQIAVAVALLIAAIGLSRAGGLGLERELAVSALRAGLQLAVVGALIALVFEHGGLAVGFVGVMLTTASITSGRRLAGVPNATARAAAAIILAVTVTGGPLLASGAFSTAPRELIPVLGILIGGAMAATSVTGQRLARTISDDMAAIETRLALGAPVRLALAPAVHGAVLTGLIPALDQTRNVGLVTLPGTFVGLILGGASPAEAARVQLTVLLALLATELVAALTVVRLVERGLRRPGERLVAPAG